MHRKIPWMQPADTSILQELAIYQGWQTAKNLSLNVDYSRKWCGQRLRKLAEYGMVERHPDEPAYRITDLGKAAAWGKISADDLRDRLEPADS